MSDNRDDSPRTDKPLHGPRRGPVVPALITLGVIVFIIAVFMLITWLQQNT